MRARGRKPVPDLRHAERGSARVQQGAGSTSPGWPLAGRCLQDSTQADIDAWYATATDPDATRTFLKWAIASRAMPRLDVPARRHAERAPISQHRRLALIHRFLTDKRIELRTRVAGCLLLLYAQPSADWPA